MRCHARDPDAGRGFAGLALPAKTTLSDKTAL
jgi:hypothetical protein